MESLFFKVICIGFFITCLTIFYEEVFEYVELKAYGNPNWLNISQHPECSCDGGKTRNCYPHPDDSELCGKCFATCPQLPEGIQKDDMDPHESEKTPDDLVFGLSATFNDVNRLLVLIASIHRNFPTTKLIIFDEDNRTELAHQLISIRNVEVISANHPGKVLNNIHTPFYLQEILSRHPTVLWLAYNMEFLNSKLIQAGAFRRSAKSAVTFISHEKHRKVRSPGYRQFFPSSSMMPYFPLAVLLKDEARSLIKWVEQCALTPECWKCDTSKGFIEDCTWMVLHKVASDAQQLRAIGDVNESLKRQSYGPPECDFYCTMYLIIVVIIAVVSFGILSLVLLKKSTKKTS